MTFDKKTRGLAPKNGYALKEKNGDLLSDHEIFLGIFSKPEDFEEIAMEEYEKTMKEREKENADRQKAE